MAKATIPDALFGRSTCPAFPASHPKSALPEDHERLSLIAEEALRKADALGVLPTPIEDILAASEITLASSSESQIEAFLKSLSEKARSTGRSMLQKIRGVADLRERTIWVKNSRNPVRRLFPTAHETAHELIPWHRTNLAYLDTSETLSLGVEERFEREANFAGAELIFQGGRFRELALSRKATIKTAFSLAENHCASKQSTLWRMMEVHDRPVALLQYYPADDMLPDQNGTRPLRFWCAVGSARFRRKFGDLEVPAGLRGSASPWIAAVYHDGALDAEESISLPCGSGSQRFEWEAWWNGYALLVLLRRRPPLQSVGRLARAFRA